MRRPYARLAAASALAAATAVFCGSALAGGGHGNDGGDHGRGSSQPVQQQDQVQVGLQLQGGADVQSGADVQGGQAQGGAQVQGGAEAHGQGRAQGQTHAQAQVQARARDNARAQLQEQSAGSQQAGMKPSSTTKQWTHTTVGQSPDVSKLYGNGTTAAAIAQSRGAPDNQPLSGPGNSQPHKTYDCRHANNPSGGVDVHAIKSYSSDGCGSSTTMQHGGQSMQKAHESAKTTAGESVSVQEQKQASAPEQQSSGHKVTICHATGSATNPYVEITVDEHALKEGHTTAKGDLVPAPAGGCPTAAQTTPVVATVAFCANGALMTKPANEVVASFMVGSNIVPPFTYNGQAYSYNWSSSTEAVFNNQCRTVAAVQGEAPVTTPATTPVTTTPTVPVTTTVTTPVTTTTTVPVTTTTPGQSTVTVTTTTPAARTTTTPSAGGVLGAQTSHGTPAHRPARGGVLGTVTHVAGSTLPFTGFPVWLTALIAVALILAGVTLRRRTAGAGS